MAVSLSNKISCKRSDAKEQTERAYKLFQGPIIVENPVKIVTGWRVTQTCM